MNKRILFLYALLFLSCSINAQVVKSTDRQAIIYLSTVDNLTPLQRKLIHTLNDYLENKKKPQDYFTHETLKRVSKQKKRRETYFLLETPPTFKEETLGYVTLRFSIKERQKTINQGYFLFSFNKTNWELSDMEDELSST